MHGTLDQFQWTESKVEDLKRFIEDKLSSGQAAREMRISRGAIMGKAYRLGLHFKSEAKTNSSTANLVLRRRKAKRTFKMVPMAPEPDARNLTLLELERNDCRYVVTDDHPMLFCGHEKAAGSSYCAHHAHVCWQAPIERNRAPRPR